MGVSMKYRSLIFCILVLVILACGCTAGNSSRLPQGKFVAIELIERDTGTLISGTIPITEGAQPMPEFFDLSRWSNASNYPSDYPPKNESLKIVVGVVSISDSPLHLTASLNRVIGVYELPYTLEPGLTITGVDDTGEVTLSFDGASPAVTSSAHYANESIHLNPGATWNSPYVSSRLENTTITFPGVGGTDYPITMSFMRSYELDNKGVFDK